MKFWTKQKRGQYKYYRTLHKNFTSKILAKKDQSEVYSGYLLNFCICIFCNWHIIQQFIHLNVDTFGWIFHMHILPPPPPAPIRHFEFLSRVPAAGAGGKNIPIVTMRQICTQAKRQNESPVFSSFLFARLRVLTKQITYTYCKASFCEWGKQTAISFGFLKGQSHKIFLSVFFH